MQQDEFLDNAESYAGNTYRPWSVDYVKDLIEYHIPQESEAEKEFILNIFQPLINNAAKTNLSNMQIVNMLKQYVNGGNS